MAYSDAPFGFRPLRHISGAPYNGARKAYWVDSSDGTALYIGDPVQVDGTSNTAEVKAAGVGTFKAGMLEGVTRATAGATNIVVGVVVGVASVTHDSLPYRAASTERIVWVADDPDLLFEVQVDEALATAAIGANTNVLFTHAGSATTGISGAEVDGTTANDATYQCVIHGFSNDPKNVANSVGNRVLVQFSLHQRRSAGGIAGV